MRSSARVMAVIAISVVGAMSAASAGATVATKTKKVSADKYAKTMCTTYNKIIADLGDFADELSGSSSSETDPAAFQALVEAAAEDFLGKVAAGERKLKRIYPDVDGGKKIGKQFLKNPVEVQQLVGDAVDEFLAADPTSPAFSASVTVFGVTLQTLETRLTDVTTGIDDQDFIEAVGDQKQCHEIFPVTGG